MTEFVFSEKPQFLFRPIIDFDLVRRIEHDNRRRLFGGLLEWNHQSSEELNHDFTKRKLGLSRNISGTDGADEKHVFSSSSRSQ